MCIRGTSRISYCGWGICAIAAFAGVGLCVAACLTTASVGFHAKAIELIVAGGIVFTGGMGLGSVLIGRANYFEDKDYERIGNGIIY